MSLEQLLEEISLDEIKRRRNVPAQPSGPYEARCEECRMRISIDPRDQSREYGHDRRCTQDRAWLASHSEAQEGRS